MRWSEINLNPSDRILRQFAMAWLLVLSAWGVHQGLVRGHPVAGAALVVMAVFGGLGLIHPAAIRWLYATCTVVAFPIGWVVSQVVLAIMFYLIITPVALLFKVRGRDPLFRKRMPEQETFWKPKPMPSDVRRYFRQY